MAVWTVLKYTRGSVFYDVRQLQVVCNIVADEFGLNKKYVTKTPSDGLCGKTDEDSFGFTYATLDGYISGGMSNTDYETALKIDRKSVV